MNIKQTKNYISTDNENSNKKINSKGSGQRRERGFTIGQNKLLLIESLTKTWWTWESGPRNQPNPKITKKQTTNYIEKKNSKRGIDVIYLQTMKT